MDPDDGVPSSFFYTTMSQMAFLQILEKLQKIVKLLILVISIKSNQLKIVQEIYGICKLQIFAIFRTSIFSQNKPIYSLRQNPKPQIFKIGAIQNYLELLLSIQKTSQNRMCSYTLIQQKQNLQMLQLCKLQLEIPDFEFPSQSPMQHPVDNDESRHNSQIFHSNKGALISIATNIGKRDRNLDRFDYLSGENFELIALYDGHGNQTVSNYLKSYLLQTLKSHPLLLTDFEIAIQETFQDIQTQLFSMIGRCSSVSGSTATIVLITDAQFFIANLGDSRALSINWQQSFFQLNTEHNLSNQYQRQQLVERGGVIVRRGKQYRLSGEINVSRSFGDFKHKPIISYFPEVRRFCRDDTKYIVIGSDGFWSQTSNQSVCVKLREQCYNKAQMLIQSLCKKPSDNCTMICYQMV